MRFSFMTEPADFVARPNRFAAYVRLLASGELAVAHCPDPGRLRELLLPGVRVHVSRETNPFRKTRYTLRLVEHPLAGTLISLDSGLPNRLFRAHVAAGDLAPFQGCRIAAAEVPLPLHCGTGVHSRIDFVLAGASGTRLWVEVKSATLVEEERARFPDAVTERGRRHVLELAELVKQKQERAAVVFVVQRADAECLMPNWDADPQFGAAMAAANAQGVEMYAFCCNVALQAMTICRQIPVAIAA